MKRLIHELLHALDTQLLLVLDREQSDENEDENERKKKQKMTTRMTTDLKKNPFSLCYQGDGVDGRVFPKVKGQEALHPLHLVQPEPLILEAAVDKHSLAHLLLLLLLTCTKYKLSTLELD